MAFEELRASPLYRLARTYAWRHRWSYAAGALFLWLTNWLTVSIPGQIGAAVDGLQAGAPIGRFAAAIAGMGLAIILVRSLSRILIFNPGRHVEYALRGDLFGKLLALQPGFYAAHKRGDIVSRASNDITWVGTLVGYGGLQVVNVTLAVTLTIWKMVALSWSLTAMVLLPIAVAMAVVHWAIRRLFWLSRRSQEQLGEISEHVLGSLQGMATIQGFVAEDAFIERFEQRNRDWLSNGMRLAVIRATALPLLVLAGGVAMYAMIAVGGRFVLAGELSVGDLAAFVALLMVFLPPLRSLGWMLSVIQRGRAALERIFELMDAEVERPEGAAGVVLTPGRGPAIELRNLDFAYPDEPEHPIFENLSATIPAGSVVGLFGRTGSGKSTLLRIVARLYNPPEGTVFVDGVDLVRLDLDRWRERLSVAPQRPFLFSDTVAANVGLDRRADPGGVRDAIGRAALGGDVAALPDGVETVVGERGIMLSGGQRQRVALARAIYRRGDVFILDDVLSSVDHTTEGRLVETVAELAGGDDPPTTLIASHRLSALRHCDTVLVLDRGRLVDSGSHAELIRRPGVYRDAWVIQSQRAPGASEAAS